MAAYYGVRRTDSDGGGGNGAGGAARSPGRVERLRPSGRRPGARRGGRRTRPTAIPRPFWETEDYRGSVTFGSLKDGVGIVFDAGRAVKLGSLTVVTDTPGYVARVEAGSSSTGPFAPVSQSQTVGRRTSFTLSVDPARRYYLLWITRLAPGYPRSHVNEVTAG